MSYKSTLAAYLAGKGKTEQLELRGVKATQIIVDEMEVTEPVAPIPVTLVTIPEIILPTPEPVKTKVPKKNKKK